MVVKGAGVHTAQGSLSFVPVIDALGARLSDMTASVDQLLHERTLPRHGQVQVEVCGKRMDVRTGGSVMISN